MKIQIRRNVFETNSSSVHTISISKVPVNMEQYMNIELRFKLYDVYGEKEDPFLRRISDLFEYMIGNDILSDFLWKRERIHSVLSKYGITCVFDFPGTEHYCYSEYCDVFDIMFSADNEDFESDIIQYIFGEGSYVDIWDNNYFADWKLPEDKKNYKSWD